MRTVHAAFNRVGYSNWIGQARSGAWHVVMDLGVRSIRLQEMQEPKSNPRNARTLRRAKCSGIMRGQMPETSRQDLRERKQSCWKPTVSTRPS